MFVDRQANRYCAHSTKIKQFAGRVLSAEEVGESISQIKADGLLNFQPFPEGYAAASQTPIFTIGMFVR
jgi:hypothetical protein